MQLNLFQWDLVEVGNGYTSLTRHDFVQARNHFERVLAASPDHPMAAHGLAAVGFWEKTSVEVKALESEAACTLFWRRLKGFAFADSQAGREFRASLIRRLIALMEAARLRYLPPDLCPGCLHLLLGEFVAAENQLRGLIETHPDQAVLYGYLADCLWLQGRRELAGGMYATALLLDTDRSGEFGQCHPPLAGLIEECGAELAPLYGYLRGILPLVDLLDQAADSPAVRVYALLQRAERARHRRDHAAMVPARRELEQAAPEVFKEYLSFVRRVENKGCALPE